MNRIIEFPVALIILDGWGVAPPAANNVIAVAHTPNYDYICSRYPWTVLSAGPSPDHSDSAAGSAEIGHRSLGAGRSVTGDAARVREAVVRGEIETSDVLNAAFAEASAGRGRVHFVGLLSDGGVHSVPESLFALLRTAKTAGVREAYVHCILDGRDVSPRTADVYVDALEIKMADIGLGRIASLCGRFYAMDSGGSWERTARAYTMLVHGEGERSFDAGTAIRASFQRGIADEFVAPIVIEQRMDVPVARVEDGDLVVFFNHNGDGMRQLVRSLAVPEPTAAKPKIRALCLTEYDGAYGLPVILGNGSEAGGIAAVLEAHGIVNHRITETARSRHVSGFFNGRSGGAGDSERYSFLNSPTRGQMETEPESRSFKIADVTLRAIESGPAGLFIVNLPAAALSAETGSFERTVEAVQYVDTCLGGIVEKVAGSGGAALITSSHTGCESFGSSNAGKIPFHFVAAGDASQALAPGGTINDVAPTLLGILGLPHSPEMTGRDLRAT